MIGPYTQEGTKNFQEFFDRQIFPFPKPTLLVKKILQNSIQANDKNSDKNIKNNIILDFFSGSCTTAHAVMQLNAEDGGGRKYIMVQLPEPCDETTEAYKAGLHTIAEIGKERIEARVLALSAYAREKIIANWGDDALLSPRDDTLCSGLVSCNPFADHFDTDKISELFKRLWDEGIVGRSIKFKNRASDAHNTGAMRFSLHLYNNYKQIDQVIAAMQVIVPAIA